MKIALINSFFSQDAGPPILPIELAYWKANLPEFDVDIHDLNLNLYDELNANITSYHLLACIFGGYTFSYPLSAFLPFNEFPFEAVPTIGLLLAFIYNKSEIIEEEIHRVSSNYGIPYDISLDLLLRFIKFSQKTAEELLKYDLVIINMPSPASVVPGIYLCYSTRRLKPHMHIIGAGNQINVPEVAKFAFALGAVSEISGNANELNLINIIKKTRIFPDVCNLDALPLPDVSGFPIKRYPVYYGLSIVPLETTRGCSYRCNFCSERLFWSSTGEITDVYREKSIDHVMKEIDFLANNLGLSGITFDDCLLNCNIRRSERLFVELEKTGLLYSGSFRVDKLSEKMIDSMAETRFTNIIIGLETLYGKSVRVYNKGGKGYSRFARQVIPFLYQNDIIPQQNILICHPYETVEDVEMAVKEIIYYKEFLENNDIPFTSSPVGTVVLNYPSASYFKVLKDPDFEIVYHHIPKKIRKQVPPEIRETFEKIPYKAVRKNCSGEEKINKIDYCAKIYNLWSNDNERMLQLKVSALAKHKEIILNKWQENQIAVRCLKEKDLEKKAAHSLLQPILSPLMGKKGEQVLISSLLQYSDKDTKQIIVPALLSLCMMGIADLVRGKMG